MGPIVAIAMAHGRGFKPPQIREKLIKIGAKVVRHGRYTFQSQGGRGGQLIKLRTSLSNFPVALQVVPF